MRKISFVILHFFFSFLMVDAQPTETPVLIKKISGEYVFFKVDELGNVFVNNKNGQLKKLNPNLDSMGVFNDVKRYGKLQSISSGNSLKTCLFFSQFKTIVVLDRMLGQVNAIDLRKSQLFQVSAICQSYDNMYWVFDRQQNKLKKIDDEGKVMLETADMQMLLSETIDPSFIVDKGGFVYIYDTEKGLFVFDIYGGFKKRMAFVNWRNLQLFGNGISGINNGKLMIYDQTLFDAKEINLPQWILNANQVYFNRDVCYLMDNEALKIYSFKF